MNNEISGGDWVLRIEYGYAEKNNEHLSETLEYPASEVFVENIHDNSLYTSIPLPIFTRLILTL